MAVDFEALTAAVEKARVEAEEATAAVTALNAVNDQLAVVQGQVSEAIAVADKENQERVAALQAIIDLVQAGI